MKKSFEINIKLSEVFKLNNTGVIYILTNPSFPQYVKIGYANDLKSRLKSLNRSECIPFAFRVYAYYKVPKRLTDLEIQPEQFSMIMAALSLIAAAFVGFSKM